MPNPGDVVTIAGCPCCGSSSSSSSHPSSSSSSVQYCPSCDTCLWVKFPSGITLAGPPACPGFTIAGPFYAQFSGCNTYGDPNFLYLVGNTYPQTLTYKLRGSCNGTPVEVATWTKSDGRNCVLGDYALTSQFNPSSTYPSSVTVYSKGIDAPSPLPNTVTLDWPVGCNAFTPGTGISSAVLTLDTNPLYTGYDIYGLISFATWVGPANFIVGGGSQYKMVVQVNCRTWNVSCTLNWPPTSQSGITYGSPDTAESFMPPSGFTFQFPPIAGVYCPFYPNVALPPPPCALVPITITY